MSDTEKNIVAIILDKVAEALGKNKPTDDILNMLPKPDTQNIGDGFIAWQWLVGRAVVESVYITRDSNPLNMEKGKYFVTLALPESENYQYSLFDESSKELGQAILSAWNWETIWKLHAGDYLLDALSVEPTRPAEAFPPANEVVEVVDAEPVDAVETVPSFDNG